MVIIITIINLGWLEWAALSALGPPSVAVLSGLSEVKEIGQIVSLSWGAGICSQHCIGTVKFLGHDSPTALITLTFCLGAIIIPLSPRPRVTSGHMYE